MCQILQFSFTNCRSEHIKKKEENTCITRNFSSVHLNASELQSEALLDRDLCLCANPTVTLAMESLWSLRASCNGAVALKCWSGSLKIPCTDVQVTLSQENNIIGCRQWSCRNHRFLACLSQPDDAGLCPPLPPSGEHKGLPKALLLFQLLSRRLKRIEQETCLPSCWQSVSLWMLPSAQVIKVQAVRGPRGERGGLHEVKGGGQQRV